MLKYIICFLLLFVYCNCQQKLQPVNFYECERSKACFKSSRSCTAETCEIGVSWQRILVGDVPYIEYEIIGTTYFDNSYIIVGFSNDVTFGDDGFVGCYADLPREPQIMMGYVSRAGDLVIKSNDEEDLIKKSADNYLGVHYENNRLMCRFRRRMVPTSMIYSLKDLSGNSKLFIYVARGVKNSDYSLDVPTAGTLIFGDIPVNFNNPGYTQVRGSAAHGSSLAKLHGILMIIAWVLCSSIGIMIARYSKRMWPHVGIANEPVWFQIHRSLQITCFLLTILATIIIFAMVQGYSKLEDLPYSAHPIIGLIIIILTVINPFLNICRCTPDSKDRPWFNWSHWLIGTIAHVLSVPAIMIGLTLPGAGYNLTRLAYPNIIMILFVLFQFVVEIILEIHYCFYYRRNKDKKHTYDMEMEEYQAALIANQAPLSKPQEPKESGRRFKVFMLTLFAFVALIVTIILVITVAVN